MTKLSHTFIAILLIPSVLLISCSASQHAGITYVSKPSNTETNEALWLTYWQDQFDAYKGNVVSPSAPEYNQNAISAYQRAKMEWDEKVAVAKTNNNLLFWGGMIVSTVVVGVILINAVNPSK